MPVTFQEPSPSATPEQLVGSPPRKRRPGLIIAAVAGVLVLIAVTVTITLAVSGRGTQPPTSDVPKIANIARPNPKCTPVGEKYIGPGDDPNAYLWFGWFDGQRAEMLYGRILLQRIAGNHKIEDAWLCPPRSQWVAMRERR